MANKVEISRVMAELESKKSQYLKIAARQQAAAASPEHSVWVEASAGTGKTKVLSDRVLRLLLSGVSPTKILCLTYTKAAAVEMNARISAKLAGWAVAEDIELNKDLSGLCKEMADESKYQQLAVRARTLFAALLDIPGGIKIQTIHSFCQEVLQRFPLEAGISPYFAVMDDRLANETIRRICSELIAKIEKEPNTPAASAINYLTSHMREFKFPELMKTLIENRSKLKEILSAYIDFTAFLNALRRKLGILENEDKKSALEKFVQQIDFQQLQKVAEALSAGCAKDKQKAEVFFGILENRHSSFDYEAYKSVFLTKEGKICAVLAHAQAIKLFPSIAEIMQKEAEKVCALELKLLKLELFSSTKAIMTIAKELTEGYASAKKQCSCLDYEDLIVLTQKLLETPGIADWVLYKLDGGISHVLIDEAQDTSPRQWAIVKALTNEFFSGEGQADGRRTVFAVGDRKQSIYSFQGADPKEFDRMSKHFAAADVDFVKVRLDVSFRSTKAVLEIVNRLFSLPQAQSGVVIEGEGVSHIPFRIGEGGKVEIWELSEAEEDGADDVWYPPVERKVKVSASLKLAQKIAWKIKNMVESRQILQSKNRPLCYHDFMVLVQRRNAFIEEFVRVCKSIGVNVSGVDKLKLLEQIAVQDLLSLGRFLLLPYDDLSLAEVLKSPLFGFTDDDLFALCYGRGTSSLWSCLNAAENYHETAACLADLLSKADYLRPFELYNYILSVLNGRKKMVSRLGSEAEDALDEFINLTLAFEKQHTPDLQTFMQWILADEVEIKRELEQSENDSVRIMTVHGSKGLQAPVVILPDTTRMANVKKSSDFLYDADNLVYFPLSAKKYDDVCLKLHEEQKTNAMDEYRRLLYVALTRAEDNLYICGCKPKNAPDEQSWYKLCLDTLKLWGVPIENNGYESSCPQVVNIEASDNREKIRIQEEIPAWINVSAPEESPLARPFMPSRIAEEDTVAADSPLLEEGNFYSRGLLIHRLLQFLPADADMMQMSKLTEAFLSKNADGFSKEALIRIKSEVLNLFRNKEFSFIFGKGSQAEVSIMGEVDGKIVSARLDRLIVSENKTVLVDFKTNRPAALKIEDVPPAYLRQLSVYKQLVQKIYPASPVETYILWTNTATLMKIG